MRAAGPRSSENCGRRCGPCSFPMCWTRSPRSIHHSTRNPTPGRAAGFPGVPGDLPREPQSDDRREPSPHRPEPAPPMSLGREDFPVDPGAVEPNDEHHRGYRQYLNGEAAVKRIILVGRSERRRVARARNPLLRRPTNRRNKRPGPSAAFRGPAPGNVFVRGNAGVGVHGSPPHESAHQAPDVRADGGRQGPARSGEFVLAPGWKPRGGAAVGSPGLLRSGYARPYQTLRVQMRSLRTEAPGLGACQMRPFPA